ncbi:MAG: hypothetical protein QM724_03405 [Flavobacteriales bacterium]
MQRQALVHLLGLAAILALAPACNKEKDTTATITVQTANGTRVEGAHVKLFADPHPPQQSDYSRLNKEGVTDSKGQVRFDYTDLYKRGQAGLGVLSILSTKDSTAGEGVIKIVEEEANEETVTLVHI